MEQEKNDPIKESKVKANNILKKLFGGQGLSVKKSSANKKMILIVVLVGIIIIAGLAIVYFKRTSAPVMEVEKKLTNLEKIDQGELLTTVNVTFDDYGSEIYLGDLKITLEDLIEGSYRPLELDEQGQRINKYYFAAKVLMYHTGNQTPNYMLYSLVDEFGNKLERDAEIEFYLGDERKDFGPAREIYPNTIREGYLIFPAPDTNAKNLQLIIYSETQNKKIIYSISR